MKSDDTADFGEHVIIHFIPPLGGETDFNKRRVYKLPRAMYIAMFHYVENFNKGNPGVF